MKITHQKEMFYKLNLYNKLIHTYANILNLQNQHIFLD